MFIIIIFFFLQSIFEVTREVSFIILYEKSNIIAFQ